MGYCTRTVRQSPEWKVYTAPDRKWKHHQECALKLYYMCLYENSYECLNSAVKMWFTGKEFKNKHYGEKFLEEMEQRFSGGKPGGWRYPARICNNIELLKQVNQWMKDKQAEHGIPQIILETDEDIKRAKELIPTLPDELKPLNVIRKIRDLPGWIKMDSPKMRKEVVYFMTHLSRTGWGEDSMNRVRELYDLDKLMPWTVAAERVYYSLTEKTKADFYDYLVKLCKENLMKKELGARTVSIIDSIMGPIVSVA